MLFNENESRIYISLSQFKTTFFLSLIQTHVPRAEYELLNQQPYLIAVGPNKSAISEFFVVVDKQLICLSPNIDFLHAFDLLFKTFYIFNIEFDLNLENFFGFIANYIYKLPNSKSANLRQIDIYNRFETKIK